MQISRPTVILVVLAALCVPFRVSATTLVEDGAYRMYRTLPARPGPEAYSSAYDVSDQGQVVGRYLASDGWYAFIWDKQNGARDLANSRTSGGSSLAVNASGQVAGIVEVNIGTYFGPRPTLWNSAGQMKDLGTLGGLFGSAIGINAAGQVVGRAEAASRYEHAFVWDPQTGLMQDLGTLGGNTSEADAINDRGQVAGVAYTGSQTHAFTWDPVQGRRDIGTLDAQHTRMYVYDINNSGQIVGSTHYDTYGGTRAWLWENGAYRDLGLSGAIAHGINDAGQVVGWFRDSDGRDQAFLWDAAVGLRVLGTPEGYVQSCANAINDDGWIAGIAWDSNGYYDVLWEPVPEPTKLACLAVGLAGVCWTRRRRL